MTVAKQKLMGFRVLGRPLLGGILLGLIGCCLSTAAVAAEIYKVVDENGNVTYTDTPPRNKKAEKIEFPQGNTLPPTRVTKRLSPPKAQSGIPTDYQLRITSPPDEFHVTPGIRNLDIQVAVEPALHPHHELQITDNGTVIQGNTMENIVVRGMHRIQAQVVDQQGAIVSQSEPIHIYVHRPSVQIQRKE
jgi:hypothetical protein